MLGNPTLDGDFDLDKFGCVLNDETENILMISGETGDGYDRLNDYTNNSNAGASKIAVN